MRTEQGAIASLRARHHLGILTREGLDVTGVVRVDAGTHLHQFSMEVYDLRAPGCLMQVVHILCHHGDIIVFLQFRHQAMTLVGFGVETLAAQHIVKLRYQFRVTQPTIVGCHFLNRVILP